VIKVHYSATIKRTKQQGEVVAKKKGTNALQRFLNVGFIAWVLFMLGGLQVWVSDSISNPYVYWNHIFKISLIGIVFPVANYILFKKITFWNKGS